ncbi:sulfite exporter TauE/SafE family protein [Herbidospora mongoliensis]|uniref:sulfite exporter TauE/SafE family protein n=1 Tax=Herbidospora mongoliensis TaxID=688067 RepID=UPI0009FF6BF4|nr:sulfite exporter TauE/SafE family protein [Herbidospora mongoliensis]
MALFLGGVGAGLLAGSVSCTAVQGGLIAGVDRIWAFLAGRAVVHVALGVLLGLAGSALVIAPVVRALVLVVAGAGVVVAGVALLRRPMACRPLKGSPFARGAATILVPCGVTLTTELGAVSSGSALAGAVLMGGFVLGSSPAFAVVGIILKRLARWAGVVVIAAGLFTVFSGVRLGGWLPDSPAVAASAGNVVWATPSGFRPSMITAPAHGEISVIFRTEGNRSCTRTVAIDGRDIALPETGQVTVHLTAKAPGTIRYSCGMGMFSGFISIR